MNIRVLAAGVLATTRRHGRENAVTEDAEMAQEQDRAERLFAVLGDRYGTRAQTALRFALAEDRLSTVVVGFAELAHLDEAIAAFETGPLPGEALDLVAGLQANGQAI